MRERDYPIYDTSSPGRRTAPHYGIEPTPLHSTEELHKTLAEIDQAQAADVYRAIEDGATLHSDVHLYRKIGSHFLGIEFSYSNGSSVRVFEHPTQK